MKSLFKRVFSLLMVMPLLLLGCAPTVNQPASNDSDPTSTDPEAPTEPAVDTDLVDPNKDGALKILFLGNSFSYDIGEIFWNIADSVLEQDVFVAILGIGAGTLQMHSRNLHFVTGEYEYKSTADGNWNSVQKVPPNDYITAEAWDYIVIQQASHVSGIPNSYEYHLDNVVEHIKTNCPNARILWHMTWAYEPDCEYVHFQNYDHDSIKMYNAIVDTVKSVILPRDDIFAVIPSGTAIQNARTVEKYSNLCRDGFHLSIPYGRYVVSLTLAGMLLDPTLSTITWKPGGISNEQVQYALEAARNALANPYEVTNTAG